MKTVKSSISPKSTLKTGGSKTAGKGVASNNLQPATTVQTGIFQNVNKPAGLTRKPRPNTLGSK